MKTILKPFITLAAILATVHLTSCADLSAGTRYAQAPTAAGGGNMKRDASQTVRVSSVKSAGASVESMVNSFGGYLISYSIEDVENYATFSARVPAPKLTIALDSFAGLGREVSRELSGVDVTGDISDDQTSLPQLRAHRQRLLSLLKTTTKVEDRLKIEAQLTELNAQIAQMEANVKNLKHAVVMSHVALRLEERKIPGPGGLVFGGLGRLFSWFFDF